MSDQLPEPVQTNDPQRRGTFWETMPGVAMIVILLVAVITAACLIIGG